MTGSSMQQRTRRAYYGLHLVIFVIAMLSIVTFVNWAGYRRYLRIDMTATRRYSLSEQTDKVVNHLDHEVRMVMLFSQGTGKADQQEQVRDLIEEYARRSGGRIDVAEIDPVYNIAEYEQFAAQLRDRYTDDLADAAEAVEQASSTLEAIRAFAATQAQQFLRAEPLLDAASPQARQFITQVSRLMQNLEARLRIEEITEQLQRVREAPLPDYAGARAMVEAPLQTLSEGLLDPAIEQFHQLADEPGASSAMKDFLLGRIEAFRPMANEVSGTLEMLDAIAETDYDEVRRRILSANSVAVMSPEHVTVLALDDVYAPPTVEPGEVQPRPRFKGEEVLTGTLISQAIEAPPLVVFVNSGQQPAIGPSGTYSHVAQMLRNMNFQVTEWTAAARQTPWGAQPPQPMPQPDAGQAMVLIVLPPPPPSPQMPVDPAQQQVTRKVVDHIKAGGPALVFIGPSPMSRFGGVDPSAPLLKPFGLVAKTDRLIFQAQVGRGGRVQPITVIELDRWPDDHPIGQSVQGLAGVLVSAVPLETADEAPEELTVWPLIETPPGTWADDQLQSPSPPSDDSPKPTGPFVAGLAAMKGDARLVVIGDTMFAADRVTRAGRYDVSGEVAYFLPYSANAELFVNSVYWLAGLDEVIATSARVQDVRRFEPISPAAQTAVWWILLAGLPVAALAAGGVVWFIRRK